MSYVFIVQDGKYLKATSRYGVKFSDEKDDACVFSVVDDNYFLNVKYNKFLAYVDVDFQLVLYLNPPIKLYNCNIKLDDIKSKIIPSDITDVIKAPEINIPKPCGKRVLCTQAAGENYYIDEWCKYHKSLGFTDIYIYDNNAEDEDDIRKYIDSRIEGIHIIPDSEHNMYHQLATWTELYHEIKNDIDWFYPCDVDEFLTLGNGVCDLWSFLEDSKFKNATAVLLSMELYGDNNLILADYTKPVLERFTKSAPIKPDQGNKAIIKGGIDDLSMLYSSTPYSSKAHAVDVTGTPIVIRPKHTRRELKKEDSLYIRHYRTKSTEEFVRRRYKYSKYYKDTLNITNIMSPYMWDGISTLTAEKIMFANKLIKTLDSDSVVTLKYVDTEIKIPKSLIPACIGYTTKIINKVPNYKGKTIYSSRMNVLIQSGEGYDEKYSNFGNCVLSESIKRLCYKYNLNYIKWLPFYDS